MIDFLKSRRPTDRGAALDQYRRRAHVYDLELAALEPVRRAAVARLGLVPGDTVLDVGCGTGLSFDLLRRQVGSQGEIVGIEQSPDMLEHARERIAKHGWTNVTLLCAPVETAAIVVPNAAGLADAALFHFTHDILRNADAIANVVSRLRPGARIVASGLQWAPLWAWPINLLVLPAALHSVTSLEGMDQPWSRLAAFTGDVDVRTMLAGGVYLASGDLASGGLASGGLARRDPAH